MGSLLYLIVFIISFVLMFNGSFLGGFILLIVSSIIYVYLTDSISTEDKRRAEIYNSLSPEEQKAYNEIQKKEALKTEIDYTILVSGDTKKSVGSAVVRGAVGSALLGPVGLIGGAISGKNKSETTFTVIYKDGHREVHTVSNDSSEFQKYASYLR